MKRVLHSCQVWTKYDRPPGVSVVPFYRHQRVAMLIPESLLTGKLNLHPCKLAVDSTASIFFIFTSLVFPPLVQISRTSHILSSGTASNFDEFLGKLDRVDTRQKQLHEPFQAQISARQARPIYCRLMISLESRREGYTAANPLTV